MDLANRHIVIVGLGVSGIAVARFAKNRGASVIVTDIASEKELAPFMPIARSLNLTMELEQHHIETFVNADMIVLSPGVPHDLLPIQQAKEKGIPVIGEFELASKYIQEPIVAITGTNGKTTTTKLLGEMLDRSGLKVFVGGNIGNPLLEYVEQKESAAIVVAEVSSFQLDTIDTFKPNVGVLLNISADHLDRYSNFEAYVRSKARIFENQKESDAAVLNGSDRLVRSIGKNLKARKLPFYYQNNHHVGIKEGAVISLGQAKNHQHITIHSNESHNLRIDFSMVNLPGRHNIENAAAASLAALAVGGTLEGVQSALNDFKGLSHRLEFVNKIDNVRFFDDSKATNVDAVARALETFDQPVVLIMGGRDKGGTFEALEKHVRLHTKKLIVMGEAKEEIKSVLGDVCRGGARTASSMDEAVLLAYQEAVPGDVVLLSPACSSFDMYNSYAERGNDFCQAVDKLKKQV
ncbi:MAG: UDP-N-acetylmuramoyl-L-alanine--D-glutamate ligase [Desulfobacterales bacterium]|nr:MAG: UDP-N-acetylmuramoyl-L-alanine--D-glutamate ligase [Desulfobacterales bacterium]